ncbi:MAG TPA: glucosaminidase domain-containing protein [Magnetospirillum sp.]|nr:glucosaminidase domain-containing protein [Magnetospirillum sp.]
MEAVDAAPQQDAITLSKSEVAHAARLDKAFKRIGYELEDVRGGTADVPPVLLDRVPQDIRNMPDAEARKEVFQELLLPQILVINAEIARDRARLVDILGRKARHSAVRPRDEAWLADLAERYGTSPRDHGSLMARVDQIPPSLALAQAAIETGWGTSTLARRSQNLFGQIAAGSDNGMRRFDTLNEAVRAYVHNLNTGATYAEFRRARAKARHAGRPLDGHALAGTLQGYSEAGRNYVSALRALIRNNDMADFDQARLSRQLRGGPAPT